jgi:hypothetical protein
MKFRSNSDRGLRLFKLAAIVAIVIIISSQLPQNFASGIIGIKSVDENKIDRYLKQYNHMAIDPASTVRKVRSTGELSISTFDGTFDLILTPHDMRGPQYHAEESVENGVVQQVVPEEVHTYRGTVTGMPGSEVRFSVHDDSLEGIILTPKQWYFVEPMRNYDSSAVDSDLVVYRASDIEPDAIGNCGTTLIEKIGMAEGLIQGTEVAQELAVPQVMEATGSILTADVATEADYEYVTALGGSSGANTSILEILNQVDGIYQSQLSVSLQVTYQHTWAASSDPYSSTDPSAMLTEFKNYWQSNYSSMTYDIAHMWTGKNMDGNVVGISYLGVICYARSYGYGISQILSGTPGKYILTAHEIGHNFGATHPDQATPVPANCSNTIMNSSVGTGTTFCSFSQSEIATHLAQYSSCLATSTGTGCDVNSDRQINVLDVQSLVNTLLGKSTCAGDCDSNNDGSVNVLDLQLLVNIILGKSTCP